LWGECGENRKFEPINDKKMATANTLIKTERNKRNRKQYKSNILIRYRDGRSIDLFAKTGFEVMPEFWSMKTQTFNQANGNRFNESFTEEHQEKLRKDLKRLEDFVKDGMNRLKLRGEIIDRDSLVRLINQFHGKQTHEKETLAGYIHRYLEEAESGKRTHLNKRKKERYKPSTLKSMRNFETSFLEFQNQRKNRVFSFDSITLDVYEDMVNFYNARNYSPNTIGRNIKYLKSIMRSAREEGLHNNQEIERRRFQTIREEVENIYLNDSEIKKIAELDLHDNPQWDEARDIFLIGCYTLQRFSDYSRIQPEMIRKLNGKTKVLDLVQRKTGERVIIPIRPELDILLSKYNYSLPKTYEQKINNRIKLVAKKAEINEKLVVEKTKGGLRVQETKYKWELITTHTARRSGCTNLFKAGVQTIDIMKLSGHKTENEFLKYIKVTKEETAERLSKTRTFRKSPLKIAK